MKIINKVNYSEVKINEGTMTVNVPIVKSDTNTKYVLDIDRILEKTEDPKIRNIIKQYKSYALNMKDIDIAIDILKHISSGNVDDHYSVELMYIAIVYFVKCFQNNKSDRIKLSVDKTLKGEVECKKMCERLIEIRNKHIAHDESCMDVTKCVAEHDGEKIIHIGTINYEFINDSSENIDEMLNLMTKVREWCKGEYEQCGTTIKLELNKLIAGDEENMLLSYIVQ